MMLLARTMMLLASSGTWAATLHVEVGGTVNVVNGGTLNIGGPVASEAGVNQPPPPPVVNPPPPVVNPPPPVVNPPPAVVNPPPPATNPPPAATFTHFKGWDSTTDTSSGHKDEGKQCAGGPPHVVNWPICKASECTFDKCKEMCIADDTCNGITWANPDSMSFEGKPTNYCGKCQNWSKTSYASKTGPWGVWKINRD